MGRRSCRLLSGVFKSLSFAATISAALSSAETAIGGPDRVVCPELAHIRLQGECRLIHDASRTHGSIFFNLSPGEYFTLYSARSANHVPRLAPLSYHQPTLEVRVTGNRRNVRHPW